MPAPRRLGFAWIVGASALGCVFPTDKSDRFTVDILTTQTEVQVGQTLQLEASVVNELGEPVPEADVFFRSEDRTVALVDRLGLLLGVRQGLIAIVATSVDFVQAEPDTLMIQVVAQPTTAIDP